MDAGAGALETAVKRRFRMIHTALRPVYGAREAVSNVVKTAFTGFWHGPRFCSRQARWSGRRAG